MSENQQRKGKEPMARKKKKQRPEPSSPIISLPCVTPPAMMAGAPSPSLHPSQTTASPDFGFHVPPFLPHFSSQLRMPTSLFTPTDSGPSFHSSQFSPNVGSSPMTQEESVSRTDVGKPTLSLEGCGFLPSHVAASAITELIRGQFNDGWPSWKRIPRAVIDMWFREFAGKFVFSPPDDLRARKNFEQRGAAILKNNLNKIRVEGKQPVWIGDAAWEKLREYWRSDGFKKLSEIAKKNQASECGGLGGSLHTCGSITSSQHRANMTKSTGVVPTPAALFRHTHQRKTDSSWVDRRSKTVYDNYSRSLEEITQQASDQGTPQPNDLDVWRDTAGVKKGRIYGLGLESTALFERPTSSSSSCEWEAQDKLKLKQLEEEMEKMKAERDEARAETAELKARFAQHEIQFKQIMDHIKFQQVKDKGKMQRVDEEHGDDDDDDDDDADTGGDEAECDDDQYRIC